MTRIDLDDPEPPRSHHGSNQTYQSEFSFMACQTPEGWEVRMLGRNGAWDRLCLASGERQACRITNALRGIVCELQPGDTKIIQTVRPKGWDAPLWLNPCMRCGTVDKPLQSVLCVFCTSLNNRSYNWLHGSAPWNKRLSKQATK